MDDDANESLTVPQLKEMLKSKGLPTSGRKSELILRLYSNQKPQPIEVKSISINKKEKSPEEEKPYLAALLQGGLSAVDVDRWQVAKYGMAAVMLIIIFNSLGSFSWYNLEHSENDGGFVFEINLNYGLSEFEIETTGYPYGEDIETYNYSKFDEVVDEEVAEMVGVDEMSTSGNILQVSLYLSFCVILGMIIIDILRGSGYLKSNLLEENYHKIDLLAWGFSVTIVLFALVSHLLITSSIDHGELFDGDYSSGLGSTWWLMLSYTLLFTCIIFNSKTKKIVGFVLSKLDD